MNSLLSLGGWTFVPDFATKHVLNFVYQTPAIHRTLRITPSPPHTAQYRRHYGVTFAFVVLGYLLYTLFDKVKNTPPNFYEVLGVASTVDDAGLKAAFRQFAKKNHPDRPEVGKQGEALFIFVRNVFEGLKDPAVRFGYDRFGPEALKWKGQCVTKAEFLWHGMLTSSGYHIVSVLVLLFWTALGRSTPFTFWRWILFFTLLVAEVALITTPSPSPSNRHITVLHKIFPQRVVYQHILFLHQLFMFLNVALLRVTPYLIPVDEFADPRLEQALLDRTTALINMADREASKMVHTELQSIANPTPSSSTLLDPGFSSTPQHPSFARMEPVSPQTATRLLNELAPEMESLIIETNVKQGTGPLRTAWEVAVGRAYKRVIEAKQEQQRREREEVEREREVLRSPSQSRETTPRPSTPSRASAPPPQSTPTPASSTSSIVKVKLEEDEGFVSLSESGYSMISSTPSPSKSKLESFDTQHLPSTPSVPCAIPRSLYKSVPRTPGELPSPRPSPSPPPGSPSLKGKRRAGFTSMTPFPPVAGVGGYFARGTAQEEGSEEALDQYDKMRARSLSC